MVRQKEEALKKEKSEEKDKGKGGEERRNSAEVTFFWHKLNSSTKPDDKKTNFQGEEAPSSGLGVTQEDAGAD